MIHMKKFFRDDLLNLALILSFLKLNSIDISLDTFTRVPALQHEISLGTSYGYYLSDFRNLTGIRHLERAIPSKHASMEFYDNVLISELNELGSFNRNMTYDRDIYAYLLNNDLQQTTLQSSVNAQIPQSNTSPGESSGMQAVSVVPENRMADEASTSGDCELSSEDADLIEILWKQDIDLGISRDFYNGQNSQEVEPALEEKDYKNLKNQTEITSDLDKSNDVWSGLNYTVDTETGEYIAIPANESKDATNQENFHQVPQPNSPEFAPTEPEQEFRDLLDSFSVENALPFANSNNISNIIDGIAPSNFEEPSLAQEVNSSTYENPQAIIERLKKEILNEATDDLPDSQPNATRLPLMHSIEERWQDVVNLLDIPTNSLAFAGDANMTNASTMNSNMTSAFQLPTTNGNLSSALVQNATLPVPIQPLSPIVHPVNTTLLDQSNFVNTATNPLSSLTNGSDPSVDGTTTNFGFENTFFPFTANQSNQNVSNQTSNSGFLSGLISDEDLELMGIAMNNTGVENINQTEDKVDVSSDSAVSSMGSERLPNFSDGEWFDSNSESSQQGQRYFGTDISPNDMYRLPTTYLNSDVKYYNMSGGANVAQKKYKFFGKRILHESSNPGGNNDENTDFNHVPDKVTYDFNQSSGGGGEIEGAMAMAHLPPKMLADQKLPHQIVTNDMQPNYVYHNHTYGMSPEEDGEGARPGQRDKLTRKQIDGDKGLSRDERRAKELLIPLSIEDIVNLSMDEFNEKISKYDFSETQLTLIRDIRRRGKNKVAAQNCRKRKLDQIFSLEDELKQLKMQKAELGKEKKNLVAEKETSYFNFLQLHDKILRSLMLRQQQINVGQPFTDPENYTLQLTPDGNVYLAPRNSTNDFPNSSNFRHQNSK